MKRNDSAIQLWEHIFATMAKAEDATLMDVTGFVTEDYAKFRTGMANAGWPEREIRQRIELHQWQMANAPVTSPGVYPHVEFIYQRLCDDIEAAMGRLHIDSHACVARGIEPRAGPLAAMTNVIMTDQSIVTVGSFLFRFCGLVARAFTRTLYLAPYLWESTDYTRETAQKYLKNSDLADYWLSIFVSYSITGTHALAPFRPANRYELMLFEQVARAMEIFAIAHEYGHHHLKHGRQIENDPKLEEYAADQFALQIGYEVERKPLITDNPYLSSGAGGVVLLRALEILQKVGEKITETGEERNDTHPEIAARLARFDTIAVLKPKEFAGLKNFRTVSMRIMEVVDAQVSELLQTMPMELQKRLRTVRQEVSGDVY